MTGIICTLTLFSVWDFENFKRLVFVVRSVHRVTEGVFLEKSHLFRCSVMSARNARQLSNLYLSAAEIFHLFLSQKQKHP
jgi:hypothetical protein